MIKIVRLVARMNVGGPARQVIELAKGLAPLGFETVVATGEPESWEGDLRPAAQAAGIRVVTIPGLGASIRPGADARALAAIVSLLRRERPAIVHTHTAKAGALGRVASRLARIGRRVHTFHGTVFDGYFSAARSRWIVRAERWLARSTDRIVAVSHATADELEKAGLPAAKIRVIPPVLDLSPFFALERRAASPDDEILVGWIGRFVPIKDPITFLEAAARVAPRHGRVRFAMVGAGPLEPKLREEASRLGLDGRIRWLPFRDDPAALYASFDWLVSSSRKEGMPLVVLEAMASGIGVVATAVGGAPELVAEERSGFLSEAGDPAKLAAALDRALDLTPQAARMVGSVARVRARERYGRERGLERHAQLYRELLDGEGILRPAR